LNYTLINDDCLAALPTLPDNSIDAIITDPPAGISFMGKDWDKDKGGRDHWITWMTQVANECNRVLKPGAHALVWALPRTSHWTATAWENAGFEVRDCVYHVFGQGFPKSLDISKAIDKLHGAERTEVIGKYQPPDMDRPWNLSKASDKRTVEVFSSSRNNLDILAPATPDAEYWQGWGTSLKPAVECWWLFRKPISEKNIAANVLKWNTGALNIDDTRIPTNEKIGTRSTGGFTAQHGVYHGSDKYEVHDRDYDSTGGRWPANLILSHHPDCELVGEKQIPGYVINRWTDGAKPFGNGAGHNYTSEQICDTETIPIYQCHPDCPIGMLGDKARFFYTPKVSSKERNEGLSNFPDKVGGGMQGTADKTLLTGSGNPRNNIMKNNHPTVKPIALMQYLITLITPPNGTILDPFMGTASTGIAALNLSHSFIGIESDPDYYQLARARLTYYHPEVDPTALI
jgi:DNA modification methylase